MDNVWIAAIVAISSIFTTVIGPTIMAIIVNRAHRVDKLEDYARQDVIAARLTAANARAEVSAKDVSQKLDTIHTLVNSNLTASMQSELDATRRELALALEVVELKKVAGKEPTVEILAAIRAASDKISELEVALKDRTSAQTQIDSSTQNT